MIRSLMGVICCGLALLAPLSWGDEQIVDTRSGAVISLATLQERLRPQSIILLGELHDNALHHQRRGALIAALSDLKPLVVAEHLHFGRTFVPQEDLLAALQQAGFDPKGWRWPVMEPMFAAIRDAGVPLVGGNIPREVARRLVREGEDAMPPEFARTVLHTPWSAEARAALEQDLQRGHCGQLDATMAPGLILAQRGRDTAMMTALSKAEGPAILLAGNGHVRRDYGVPSLLRAHLPGRSVAIVGFVEAVPAWQERLPAWSQIYDYVWLTDVTARPDPCASFGKPSS